MYLENHMFFWLCVCFCSTQAIKKKIPGPGVMYYLGHDYANQEDGDIKALYDLLSTGAVSPGGKTIQVNGETVREVSSTTSGKIYMHDASGMKIAYRGPFVEEFLKEIIKEHSANYKHAQSLPKTLLRQSWDRHAKKEAWVERSPIVDKAYTLELVDDDIKLDGLDKASLSKLRFTRMDVKPKGGECFIHNLCAADPTIFGLAAYTSSGVTGAKLYEQYKCDVDYSHLAKIVKEMKRNIYVFHSKSEAIAQAVPKGGDDLMLVLAGQNLESIEKQPDNYQEGKIYLLTQYTTDNAEGSIFLYARSTHVGMHFEYLRIDSMV